MRIKIRAFGITLLLGSLLLAGQALAQEPTLCDNILVETTQDGTTYVYNGNQVPIVFDLDVTLYLCCPSIGYGRLTQQVLQAEEINVFVPDVLIHTPRDGFCVDVICTYTTTDAVVTVQGDISCRVGHSGRFPTDAAVAVEEKR